MVKNRSHSVFQVDATGPPECEDWPKEVDLREGDVQLEEGWPPSHALWLKDWFLAKNIHTILETTEE